MPDLHATIAEGEITVPIEIKDKFGNYTIHEEIATGQTQTGRGFRALWCFPIGIKVELLDEEGHAEVSAMVDMTQLITECVTSLLSVTAVDQDGIGIVEQEPVTIEESGG